MTKKYDTNCLPLPIESKILPPGAIASLAPTNSFQGVHTLIFFFFFLIRDKLTGVITGSIYNVFPKTKQFTR